MANQLATLQFGSTTTILGITAAVLAIATGYFAYKSSKTNDQFLDQKDNHHF